MKHREIWHQIHIKASPKKVFEALANIKNLARWWTTDTRGESEVGKKLEFWFNGYLAAEMSVTALKEDALVRWQVTKRSIPDWVNTELEWKILRDGKKTILHLRHSE